MTLDPKYRAVCFDMDGTLLDTKVDYMKMACVIYDVMAEIGVPEEHINRSGSAKFNIDSGIEWLSKNGREDDVFSIYRKVAKAARDIEMERVSEAKPFPGTLEMLVTLKQMGYKIGVLTRGCREYAETALFCVCGLRGILDAVVARDDYSEKEAKPSPVAMQHIAEKLGVECEEILFIGDHAFDYQCARDSGAGFIGVLSCNYGVDDWRSVSEDIPLMGTAPELMDRL